MITKVTNKQKKAHLISSGLLKKAAARTGLSLILMLFVSTLVVQKGFTKQFDDSGKHRATLIDIDGNEINQDHPRYAKIAEESGISVHIDDSLALVAMYHSMSGEYWRDNTGWLTEKVEFWVGVNQVEEIEPDVWRVTRFIPPRGNMTVPGTIAPEIEKMEYLERFRVQNDLLTGPILPEFGKLRYLTMFWPQNNFLSGEVPWMEFAQLKNLDNFSPRQNFLSGEIPSWIGEEDGEGNPYFPVLERFFIQSNNFTGELPASIENFHMLERFDVGDNRFTGDLPDFSRMENITYFFIENVDFTPGPFPEMIKEWDNIARIKIQNTNRTGKIPDWFGELTSLERVQSLGGQDEIGGELPESIKFMPNLWDFRLQGGNFSGPIPGWLAEIPSLEILKFSDVDFTGTLPQEFADAVNLERIEISGSNVEGDIPEVWQTLSRMQEFELSDNPNMEVGDIPDWMADSWTDLEVVNISNVGVTGEIPANFSSLDGLDVLILKDNPDLTGELPDWLGDRNLEVLSLSNSGLTINEIPSWIQNSTRLSVLELGGYGIEGTIPDWLGGDNLAPTLKILALDNNNLSGEIPASLGNLFVLDSLNLAHNNLSGEIPDALKDLGKTNPEFSILQAVVLSGNVDLRGEMPMFPDATFMRVVEFEDTDLCEPSGFDTWADEIEAAATANFPIPYYNVKGTGVACEDEATSTDPEARPYIFQLQQNYPNPFNPSTAIKYELPSELHVRLDVYNIIGQRVATLVNDVKPAGAYEVNFDASDLASGTYIYRLHAGNNKISQTMMLLK